MNPVNFQDPLLKGCCKDKRILDFLSKNRIPYGSFDPKQQYRLYAWDEKMFWGCKTMSSQPEFKYQQLEKLIGPQVLTTTFKTFTVVGRIVTYYPKKRLLLCC